MHGVLSLVCKRWREIVDNESFRGKVQRKFLDSEFSAKFWSEEKKKQFYYSGFSILECIHCRKTFKDRHGYYRDPKSRAICYYPPNDVVDNLYCRDCSFIPNFQDMQEDRFSE